MRDKKGEGRKEEDKREKEKEAIVKTKERSPAPQRASSSQVSLVVSLKPDSN